MGNIYRSRPLNEIDITIQDLYNIVGNKIANEVQKAIVRDFSASNSRADVQRYRRTGESRTFSTPVEGI